MDSGIPVKKFYGESRTSKKRPSNVKIVCPVPYKQKSLLSGPPLTWKIFKKQGDALDFMRNKGFGLMSFAFETQESRLFLVAHPEIFWHYDIQRPKENRCSYEIIPELSACKLYFDIEFNVQSNPNKDSNRMVSNFISIVIHFLEKKCGVKCVTENVLVLDSTTEKKFSQHLIFDVPCVCFINNYHVGNFVRFICDQILISSDSGALNGLLVSSGVSLEDVCELIVLDNKGNKTVFCDQCVYSKNRHFRIYGSTKKGKNSPLVYQSDQVPLSAAREKEIFLSSLITFIQGTDRNKVIHFGEDTSKVNQGTSSLNSPSRREAPKSPYPDIDSFISSIISPGRIFRSVFFSSSNVILYDIIGYRFCGNISREHKSNNIKYVVDMSHCCYYQKCHDWDCVNYKSEKQQLPSELIFKITDCQDSVSDAIGIFSLPEQDLNSILEAIETSAVEDNCSEPIVSSTPSNEEMNSILDALETENSADNPCQVTGTNESTNISKLQNGSGSLGILSKGNPGENTEEICLRPDGGFNEILLDVDNSSLNSDDKSPLENGSVSDSQFPSYGLPDEAFLNVTEGMDS